MPILIYRTVKLTVPQHLFDLIEHPTQLVVQVRDQPRHPHHSVTPAPANTGP
jgi:hypothetical protein